MRLVGTLSNEDQARRLANYLSSQRIASTFEVSFDPKSSHMAYQVWIHEEDKIQEALAIFEDFSRHPMDTKFDAPPPEPEEPRSLEEEPPDLQPIHRYKAHVTHFFLSLCVLIFFISFLQEIPLRKEGLSEQTFLITPLQADLMYDLPPGFEQLEKTIEKYELNDPNLKEIPPAVTAELQALEKTPYWRGLYYWVVSHWKGEDSALGLGPLFLKIRQGQIWRLFSPVLLHYDLLHILFNMLWLWYLGRPIEQRIGPSRTLLLTLITGIGSNTLQYLMSGPFFIGYSGIVTALAGFIWMREKVAPWEGYPLNKATILFLLFFIAAIFGLQVVAFLIETLTTHSFAPNIANTAHIGGALIGAYLGRFKFFAQRVHK